jgi:hypothetical protein
MIQRKPLFKRSAALLFRIAGGKANSDTTCSLARRQADRPKP